MSSWLSNIVGGKLSEKKTTDAKKYHVRTSDKKVVTAYKNQTGAGYVYHKRGTNGTRNVPVKNNLYKTEDEAKKKVERLRKASTSKKSITRSKSKSKSKH